MSSTATRAVVEGTQPQGINERVIYTLTTTPVGPSPSSPACYAYDVSDARNPLDVSATNLTGAASAVGDVITAPVLHSLTLHHRYRLVWRWTSGSNVFERYVEIVAEL